MTESTLWWMATGAAITLELLSGTFYLLMLSIGLAAAALAAHAGASLTLQLVTAAIVGGGAVLVCYFFRKKNSNAAQIGSDRNVNMDVGETVQVESWLPDGSTSVKYRGAQWSAIHASGALPSTGAHRIVEVRGNQLVIEKYQP